MGVSPCCHFDSLPDVQEMKNLRYTPLFYRIGLTTPKAHRADEASTNNCVVARKSSWCTATTSINSLLVNLDGIFYCWLRIIPAKIM